MKLGTQNKLSMLTVNIVIGIDDLDQKYKFAKLVPKLKCASIFIKFGT